MNNLIKQATACGFQVWIAERGTYSPPLTFARDCIERMGAFINRYVSRCKHAGLDY